MKPLSLLGVLLLAKALVLWDRDLAWSVWTPLAYLWLVFYLDTQVHLSLAGRVLASLGLLAGVGWAAVHLVRRWRDRPPWLDPATAGESHFQRGLLS